MEHRPVFVGGTGRCGTHVIAALAGRSSRYTAVPAELRLHAEAGTLSAFVRGRTSRRRLVGRLRTHWWRHRPPWDPTAERGAHRIVPRHRYAAAVARLAASPPGADRARLSRRLVRRLLDPLAQAPGAWVEKSPDNCAAAGFLHRVFPDMRLIHVIRDGRDVACSFMRVPWAPDDFGSALALWERRLLDAHLGALAVPGRQVHRVMLEDLITRDRDGAYRALLDFLEIPQSTDLRSFFDRELTPGRASLGRWRTDLPPLEHERMNSLYRESLERLDAAGVEPLPELRDPPEPAAERSPSPLDPWSAPAPSF